MKQTRILMGMPISIEISDSFQLPKKHDLWKKMAEAISEAFDYFSYVDSKFSTYKGTSEIMKINRGELSYDEYSRDMKEIMDLAQRTKLETAGYFDIQAKEGYLDPSGIVKGWAIRNASNLLVKRGFENHYVEAGGDIQVRGEKRNGVRWSIGIRNPFRQNEIIKIVHLRNEGVATSGTYLRGQHIYDPHDRNKKLEEIVSFTVIGPDVYEADRFATAAFAMGKTGIEFIEKKPGLEGYMVDKNAIAHMTSGFHKYTFSEKNELHRQVFE